MSSTLDSSQLWGATRNVCTTAKGNLTTASHVPLPRQSKSPGSVIALTVAAKVPSFKLGFGFAFHDARQRPTIACKATEVPGVTYHLRFAAQSSEGKGSQ